MIPSFPNLPFSATLLSILLGLAAVTPVIWRRSRQETHRWRVAKGALTLIGLASAYAMILGGYALLATPSVKTTSAWFTSAWMPDLLPPLRFELSLDALSAFFLTLIGFFALTVTIYSFGALKARHYRAYRLDIVGAYGLFVWGVIMTVLVHDVFSLLLALEITTLAFAALTLFKSNVYRLGELEGDAQQRKEARLAPKVYLIISHASSAFLVLGFLLLAAPAHSLSFAHLRAQTPFLNNAAFWLLFIGLGIRAGLVPAHIWPPLVHPASPTTTHAFSLGMGIKVALYLMIRVFFQFLDIQPWWGLVVFSAAAITALINVWYAIASHDLKTALAYHSIENIGIMLAGVGLAMYGLGHGPGYKLDEVAALALMAGLFHALNHGVFKSLLYLGTGAIENLTHGEVHMERLGGLLRFFPITGGLFLVGAFAISGFPPFNGFVSEWLTIKANLGMFIRYASNSGSQDILWSEIIVLLAGFMLLVTSFALTAFCFYKIAGLTLFGNRPSRGAGWEKKDVAWIMLGPMALLGAITLAVGLFPRPVLTAIASVTTSLGLPDAMSLYISPTQWSSVNGPIPFDQSLHTPLIVAALILIALLAILPILAGALKRPRRGGFWQGGVADDLSLDQVRETSAALSYLIRRQLSPPVAPTHQKTPAYLPDVFVMAEGSSPEARQTVVEWFRAAYNRLIHLTFESSHRFAETVQNGDIRRYMAYILVVYLVLLLLFMMILL